MAFGLMEFGPDAVSFGITLRFLQNFSQVAQFRLELKLIAVNGRLEPDLGRFCRCGTAV